eukprot:3794260-Lingulodinium_polyedra.AAC.1
MERRFFHVAVSRATQLAILVGDASAARKVGFPRGRFRRSGQEYGLDLEASVDAGHPVHRTAGPLL